MRTYLDCYPCLLGQALEAARMARADEREQRHILERVLDLLRDVPPSSKPPQISQPVHRIVREEIGSEDPYRETKARSTEEGLALYPWMERALAEADDKLVTAARLSIAGNVIDARPGRSYDLREELERSLSEPLAIDDAEALRAALNEADWALFLADNAGETVCDRLLIETMGIPVTYVVKGGPIANDATVEDAQAAGVDRVAELMSSGSDAPGTLLEQCSEELRRAYEEAPLIIAKGQGNYESLDEAGPRVFFLLQAKCPVLARDVGVPARSLILRQGDGSDRDCPDRNDEGLDTDGTTEVNDREHRL